VAVNFIGGGNLRTGYENKDISLNDIFFYQLPRRRPFVLGQYNTTRDMGRCNVF
jgi:hypothetical protein